MSNVSAVPVILVVTMEEVNVRVKRARLYEEADWIDVAMIDGERLEVPEHLQGLDVPALSARRAGIMDQIEGLQGRFIGEVVERTFSITRIGNECFSEGTTVGFFADGRFFFEKGALRPSDEELSELSIQALRELLAA